MLGLGLAASNAPSMFRSADEWPVVHQRLVGDVPQPLEFAQETPEVIEAQIRLINAGFAALGQRLEAFGPDVLLVLGSDNGRVFTRRQIPQFATFLGTEIWGSTRLAELAEEPEDDIVRLPCAPALASALHAELVASGFDMSYSEVLRPLGQPEYGTSPAFVAPVRALRPKLDLPILPIHVNAHVPPAPSGRRCYELGRALASILADRPERVALLASGGLSHDHFGPRAGWIDPPLDQWVLDQLARARGTALERMYDLESDTLHGGAAEIRSWIIVAGACEAIRARASVVSYIPSYSAATGIGFAYWAT